MIIKASQIKTGYKIRNGSHWEVVESTTLTDRGIWVHTNNDTSSTFFEDHEHVMVIKRSA